METPDYQSNDSASSSAKENERIALKMVADALKIQSYSATQLCLAMRVMITAPCAVIPLRQAVEKVVSSLCAKDLKERRCGLLKYYAITGDYGKAAKFLPKQGKEAVSEYLPAMLVYLDQGKLKAAKSVVQRCLDFVPTGEYSGDELRNGDFIEHGLHAAIAAYYARTGKRLEAIRFWKYTMPQDYLFAEAMAGPVYAQVVRALFEANAAVNALLNQQLNERFAFDEVPETDALERRPRAIEALQRLRDGLLDLLPIEQQRSFSVRFSGLRPSDTKEGQ